MAEGPHDALLEQTWHARPWDQIVPGAPYNVAASTTDARQLLLKTGSRVLVVGLGSPGNITSLTVVGTGSGITYLSVTGAQTNGFFVVQVLPAIDDHLTLTVVTGAGGPTLVYPDVLHDPGGLSTSLPGNVGGPISLRHDYSADDVAGTNLDEVGIGVWDTAENAQRLWNAASVGDADDGEHTAVTELAFNNGASFARLKSSLVLNGGGAGSTPIAAIEPMTQDALNGGLQRWFTGNTDAVDGTNILGIVPMLRYATTLTDRQRSLSHAADGQGVALVIQPSSTPVAATAAVNTAVVATITGVAGQQIRLTYLSFFYSGTLAAATIATVSDGTTTYNYPVTAVGESGGADVALPPGGIKFAAGASVVITLPAGGAAGIGYVNAAYLIA